MSLTPHNEADASVQSECVRLIQYNRKRADDAYEAHLAMIYTELSRPALADNPAWTALRQDAFENFTLAFNEVGK